MRSFLPSLVATTLALSAFACGAGDTPRTNGGSDEIVDVPQSSVKNQSISNCWLYATMGWAESLHVATGEAQLDISESYLTYWHWFDQLVWDGAPGKTAIDETGYFHQGLDLVYRFGLVKEADFAAVGQSAAKAKMDRSMREGALKDEAARKDKALVRRELDAAFGLSPELVEKMNAVFGEGYDRSLDQPGTMPAGTPIRRAQEIPILAASASGGPPRRATLADAIGDRAWDEGWGLRKGPLSWNELDYPSDPAQRRAFQIRIQKALHARQPVVISWFIDFNAMNGSAFKAPPQRPGRQGGHVTVLEDYQINDVPGFGTLKAGVNETRADALTAALDPRASIEFFRTKNSWGLTGGPSQDFAGYLDLYTAYLHGPVKKCDRPEGGGEEVCVDHQPLWRAALPQGF